MSDNLRRYRAIRSAIRQLYPTEPRGNTVRHLHTLTALISGIVGSRSTNLPTIAGKVPDGTKRESRVKKLSRWMKNERINAEIWDSSPVCDDRTSYLRDVSSIFGCSNAH